MALVYYDIQTSGLGNRCDVLQIGAVCRYETFSVYITPTRPIPEEITDINGFEFFDGVLYHNGRPVHSVPLYDGVVSFLEFLEEFNSCVLVAHNGAQFDDRILKRYLDRFNLYGWAEEVIEGFINTREVFEKEYPDLESHSQAYLADICLEEDQIQDAFENAAQLRRLVRYAGDPQEMLRPYTRDF